MANEFIEVIKIIGEVIWWILKRLVDLILIVLLLASNVFPWRWIEWCNVFDEDDWREQAILGFLLTIADCVCIPMGLLSLASPCRWKHLVCALEKYDVKEGEIYGVRWAFVMMFMFMVLDFITVPFAVISLLMPFRLQILMIEFQYIKIDHSTTSTTMSCSTYQSYCWDISCSIISAAISSVLDLIVFIPGCIFTLFVPTIWQSLRKGMQNCRNDYDEARMCYRFGVRTERPVRMDDEYADYRWNLRVVFASQVAFALNDIISLPFGMIALCSPFRHRAFRVAMATDGATWLAVAEPSAAATTTAAPVAVTQAQETIPVSSIEPSAPVKTLDVEAAESIATVSDTTKAPEGEYKASDTSYYEPGTTIAVADDVDAVDLTTSSIEVRTQSANGTFGISHFNKTVQSELHPMDYNISLRKHCFYYGTTAIVDFLLFPLLLPLLLTWYRLRPVRNALFDSSVWSLHEFGIILQQFSFLFLDVFFVPGGILLFLTRIRWWPVHEAMKLDDLCSFRSLTVYGTIILQCLLLLADVIVLPAVVVLTLTYYRIHPLVVIWSNHHLWHDDDEVFYFHFTAIANFLLVVHDLTLLPMLFLVILLSGIRFETGISLLKSAVGCEKEEPVQRADASHSADAPSAPPIAVAERIRMPQVFPSRSWRKRVWIETWNVLLDIPFYLMALVVVITVWRCGVLYHDYVGVSREGRHVNRRRRKVVFFQFIYLLRDVFCLIPLVILIGTLYRVPEVILELLSQLSHASDEDPVFNVINARIECKERGGPKIALQCRRNNRDIPPIATMAGSRIYASGTAFWKSVEELAGSAAVSLCKSLLPLKLANERHINLNDVTTYIEEHPKIECVNCETPSAPPDVEAPSLQVSIVDETKDTFESHVPYDTSDVLEVWLEPDIGTMKRTTVLKKLQQLNQTARVLIQVECKEESTGKSIVLASICPTIGDLTSAYSLSQSDIPVDSLDQLLSYRRNEISSAGKEDGIVDSFWLIVLKSFFDLCLDIAYSLLAILTVIAPWRWVSMMVELFEPAARLPWRGMKQGMKYLKRSEQLFLQYMEVMVPAVNDMAKVAPAEYTLTNSTNFFGLPIRRHEEEFKKIDMNTFVGYHKYRKEALKRFSKSSGSEHLVELAEEYTNRLERRLAYWAYITYFHIWAGNGVISDNMHNVCGEYIHMEERKNLDAIHRLRQKMDEEVERVRIVGHASKKWGVWRKSSKDSRKIVLMYFKRALRDVAGICMIFILLITVIRLIPFLADLKKIGTCNVTRFSFRQVLIKHARGIAEDIAAVAKFSFFVIILCILMVGLPAFLSDLPYHTSSLKEMTRCAKRHVTDTCYYIFELLALIFACRTVEVTLRASLFSVLVPAACVAEGLPKSTETSSSKRRLAIGSVIWFGLLASSIAMVVVAITADSESSVRNTLLGVLLALLGCVVLASLSLCQRSEYLTPCKQALRAWSLSWSHILAVLTGPAESLQLASVVMYFYWNRSDGNDKTSTSFPFCSIGAHNDCGGWISFEVAVGLAVCCMLLWVLLVSVPLALDDDNDRSEYLFALQTHSMYDMTYTIISRILFVSILATALRPYSCLSYNGSLVLSTDHSTECGDEGSWSSLIALPLLMYFVITSCILHSDAPEFVLRRSRHHNRVQFAPMYALVMKMLQVAILILCFASRATKNDTDTTALSIIIAISGGVFFGAIAYGSHGCSLQCVNPLRAAGLLAITYTAAVCYFHNIDRDWADSTALFIGWGCIFGMAILIAVYVQWCDYGLWKLQLQEAGLGDTIAAIGQISDVLLTEEAVSNEYKRGDAKNRIAKWRHEAERALSTYHIGQLLLKLEQDVLFERLTLPFLNQIHTWRENFTDRRGALHSNLQFDQLNLLANELLQAIKPRSSLTLVTRNLLTLVMRRKLPVEISWEIFSFLVDTTQVKIVLLPLNFIDPFNHENKYYKIYSATTQLFTATALKLNTVIKQIQTLDENLYGFSGITTSQVRLR